ncbi:MAG TPA: hypothetical protein VJ063_11415 [Verrucomicrobiae bacterium]|nr:hypothetical protein [Verrucomicrobiae bacterium]
MKWRLIVGVSLLLNAILVAAYLSNRRGEVAPESTSTVTIRTNAVRVADQSRSLRPLTVEMGTNAFHWGTVESPDYREYIANLRAIGCPEETIRDIIIADVNKLFASRVAALYPAPKDYKFWRVQDRTARQEERARDQKRRELDKEKRGLIKELLGIDYDVEMARWNGRPDDEDYRHGFLSPDKQELLSSIQAKYREMERGLMGDGGFRNPENRAKITALRAQREAELAQALGPADFQEYQLRNSFTARNMRDTLTSFGPTEDEFRQIFEMRKQFDDQFGFTRDGGDQAMREQRQAAQAKLDEQLRAVLGDQRYHDYVMAQDDRYREMFDFTDRNGLPRTTADALYDIAKTARDVRQQIANNKTLSPEEQQLALAKIAEETWTTVTPLLGNKFNLNDKDVRRLMPELAPAQNNTRPARPNLDNMRPTGPNFSPRADGGGGGDRYVRGRRRQ